MKNFIDFFHNTKIKIKNDFQGLHNLMNHLISSDEKFN